MKRLLTSAAAVTAALCAPLFAAGEVPGVYVILDGPESIWSRQPDGTYKLTFFRETIREVVKGFVADDYLGRELAFRVYGGRENGICRDSELVVPFSAPAA
ncbi:MAG: hypothetical protein GY953_03655, partial [bacterium]|nr:hypothetical protein [bacterium]